MLQIYLCYFFSAGANFWAIWVIFGPFWQFWVIFGPYFVAKYASVLFKSLFAKCFLYIKKTFSKCFLYIHNFCKMFPVHAKLLQNVYCTRKTNTEQPPASIRMTSRQQLTFTFQKWIHQMFIWINIYLSKHTCLVLFGKFISSRDFPPLQTPKSKQPDCLTILSDLARSLVVPGWGSLSNFLFAVSLAQ